MMICISRLVALGVALLPGLAAAHVNWFVEQDTVAVKSRPEFYLLTEPEVMLAVAGAAVILFAAWCVHQVSHSYSPARSMVAERWERHLVRFVEVFFGLFLLLNALDNLLFVPHFQPVLVSQVVLLIEALAGILLMSGQGVRYGGMMVVALYLYFAVECGLISCFEYLNLVGLGIFLSVISQERNGASQRFQGALFILRLTVATALITLGFSEKLLNPHLALDFLAQYPEVNFMGQWAPFFSDRVFVLFGGVAEVLFGCVYLFGLVTRINTICLAVFLVASNSYFFWSGRVDAGLMELVGHTPLLLTALLFLVFGGGTSRFVIPGFGVLFAQKRFVLGFKKTA